jgi:hypothetical protein
MRINPAAKASATRTASVTADRERMKCMRARTGEVFIAKGLEKTAKFFSDIRMSPTEWDEAGAAAGGRA